MLKIFLKKQPNKIIDSPTDNTYMFFLNLAIFHLVIPSLLSVSPSSLSCFLKKK